MTNAHRVRSKNGILKRNRWKNRSSWCTETLGLVKSLSFRSLVDGWDIICYMSTIPNSYNFDCTLRPLLTSESTEFWILFSLTVTGLIWFGFIQGILGVDIDYKRIFKGVVTDLKAYFRFNPRSQLIVWSTLVVIQNSDHKGQSTVEQNQLSNGTNVGNFFVCFFPSLRLFFFDPVLFSVACVWSSPVPGASGLTCSFPLWVDDFGRVCPGCFTT